MNSPVFDVPIRELLFGDVIIGVGGNAWGLNSEWKVIELPENFNETWVTFLLSRIRDDERSQWHPHIDWVAMVKREQYQYDPSQQGDTEEDI